MQRCQGVLITSGCCSSGGSSASAIAVAHAVASAHGMVRAAVPRRAASMRLLLKRRQRHFGDGRRAYDRVSSRDDACSGAIACCLHVA